MTTATVILRTAGRYRSALRHLSAGLSARDRSRLAGFCEFPEERRPEPMPLRFPTFWTTACSLIVAPLLTATRGSHFDQRPACSRAKAQPHTPTQFHVPV